MKNASMLQMVIRISGVIQLILGIMVWASKFEVVTSIHILVGAILTIALLMLAYLAFRAGVSRGIVILAVIWALILPVWGLNQENVLPQSLVWIAQLAHVLLGLGAVGIGEMLGARLRKQST